MRLLLDTHLLIWGSIQIEKLSSDAMQRIHDPKNELVFSVASLWEMAIKRSLRKKGFSLDPGLLRRSLLDNGYEELSIQSRHALYMGSLPLLHKDPFDRILIAQAAVEGLLLLTMDSAVAEYPGPIQKV